jgi:hypothetical protein
MESLLTRLERRLGRLAIPNLITFMVGGMAIVFVLTMLKPEFEGRLLLDLGAVRRGEVWRLVTFLFVAPDTSPGQSPFWVLVSLYFTWWLGSSLEQQWGAFKFNAFYFVGWVATIGAAVATGYATDTWLDTALLLAFATVFPEVQILLFFVLPIRVKWTGLAALAYMAYRAYTGDWVTRASIIAALLAYGVFFAGFWIQVFKERKTLSTQRSRLDAFRAGNSSPPAKRSSVRPPPPEDPRDAAPVFGHRVCAICGAEEAAGADIRVCTCEKCGGKPRSMCLEHARNH